MNEQELHYTKLGMHPMIKLDKKSSADKEAKSDLVQAALAFSKLSLSQKKAITTAMKNHKQKTS